VEAALTFTRRLQTAQRRSESLLCIGLDTDLAKIPHHLRRSRSAFEDFNRRIIDATHDLVCAYKLNLAFYEALGERSWRALRRTLAAIPPEVITIGDAKRGDIGNSAAMYARVLLEDLRFAATTVSPYMGDDAVAPFIARREQGAFILALTSNPGAHTFQYLPVRRRPLYEHVVAKAMSWNTLHNCGLVVGATHPRELRRIRSMAPGMPILIPGVGTQGGDLESSVRYGCDGHGELAVINVGRRVLYASGGKDFASRARVETLALRDAIRRARDRML
jgi:orotidine-5'-phosphate decarboxylase